MFCLVVGLFILLFSTHSSYRLPPPPSCSFEHSLVEELKYTGFERIRRVFNRAFQNDESKIPQQLPVVVDAGCGTGLVGEQFRNVSSYLIGVDLSESIIQEAVKRRPGLYDETIVGDITEVFREKHPISMIVAADSYIYFGDIEPLFESMEAGLMDGGYAVFTMENASKELEERYVCFVKLWSRGRNGFGSCIVCVLTRKVTICRSSVISLVV